MVPLDLRALRLQPDYRLWRIYTFAQLNYQLLPNRPGLNVLKIPISAGWLWV